MKIDNFIRSILSSLQLEYSELEESCPEILWEIIKNTETFTKKVIKLDRENVAKHAKIYDSQKGCMYEDDDYYIEKNSIINAPNIELL